MTTLGHSLTGLAALTLCLPPRRSPLPWAAWAVFFIALANIPDWPLPFWGHRQLAVSHSLWVNLILCTGLAALLRLGLPAAGRHPRMVICAALAWLSHLLLDTLYGDLPGVAIYWPFSDRLASLPLPWLGSLQHPPPALRSGGAPDPSGRDRHLRASGGGGLLGAPPLAPAGRQRLRSGSRSQPV